MHFICTGAKMGTGRLPVHCDVKRIDGQRVERNREASRARA
jgi:hypothetical protein